LSVLCGEAGCRAAKDHSKDEARDGASGTLRRLVSFVASALDVRYTFVARRGSVEGGPEGRMAVWLARDYGLRSAFVMVDAAEDSRLDENVHLASLLRRGWPHETDLAAVERDDVVSVALCDGGGQRLGYLGIVDPEGRRRFAAREALRPLVRAAASELERWVAAVR
jgi:hypothetical protein